MVGVADDVSGQSAGRWTRRDDMARLKLVTDYPKGEKMVKVFAYAADATTLSGQPPTASRDRLVSFPPIPIMLYRVWLTVSVKSIGMYYEADAGTGNS